MRHLILLRPSREVAVNASRHLSADDVAAFIDRSMPDEERADADRHLADCDECREEVTSVARLVATAPMRSPRRAAWSVLIPLAAATLVAVVWRGSVERADAPRERERGAPSEGSRITIVAPEADATLARDQGLFVWHAIQGSDGYHVVIKDVSGALVWSGDAADTTQRLPDSAGLRTGETYVWRVDGQRTDGTTASSAETRFRVAP